MRFAGLLLLSSSVAVFVACAPKATSRPARTPTAVPGPFDVAASMIPDGAIIKKDNPAFGKTTPAFDHYKNVTVMDNVPADRFMTAMLALQTSIGAECKECHPGEKWESDEMKAKSDTRVMVRMNNVVNVQFFDRAARVTCYTCHRGKWTPSREPPLVDQVRPAKKKGVKLTDAEASKPSEQVFKSVKSFQGKSAGSLMAAMNQWTAALAVECTHCHADNYDWAAEEIGEKDVTREMVTLMKKINDSFFKGEPVITCWGCHRGQAVPDRVATVATKPR